jgi:hypothetical protein
MAHLSQQEQQCQQHLHQAQHLWLKLHGLTRPLKSQPQAPQRGPQELKPQMQMQMKVQMLSRVRPPALKRLVLQEKVSQRLEQAQAQVAIQQLPRPPRA